MSAEQEISNIVQEAEGIENTLDVAAVALTVKEVENLLEGTNNSLHAMCMRVEKATSKDGVKAAFRDLNRVMRIFLKMASEVTNHRLVLQAICSLGVSPCFEGILTSATSLREGLTGYKTAVLRDLASFMQQRRDQADLDDELDDDLISQFLPGLPQSSRGT